MENRNDSEFVKVECTMEAKMETNSTREVKCNNDKSHLGRKALHQSNEG